MRQAQAVVDDLYAQLGDVNEELQSLENELKNGSNRAVSKLTTCPRSLDCALAAGSLLAWRQGKLIAGCLLMELQSL